MLATRRFTRSTRSVTRFDAADDACSPLARTVAIARAGAVFFLEVAGGFDDDFVFVFVFGLDFDFFDGLAGALFIRSRYRDRRAASGRPNAGVRTRPNPGWRR